MNAAADYQSETIQKDLAAGILKQAAQDLRRFHNAASGVERELYLDAHSWVMSNDSSWPFSFLNVCQLLNLQPEAVRDDLPDELSLGAFGYWSRRCGRAARRFQIFLGQAFTNKRNANSPNAGALTAELR
jgi:hypothetical protein